MASDATEETTYLLALQKVIAEIPGLARWMEPDDVVVRDDIEEVLECKFRQLLIGIFDTDVVEDTHAFGKSGMMEISSSIIAIVGNSEGAEDVVPEDLAGQPDSRAPSVAVVDGLLRNGLHATTLGGFIIAGMSTLEPGGKVRIVEPAAVAARQWIFTAFKEVER